MKLMFVFFPVLLAAGGYLLRRFWLHVQMMAAKQVLQNAWNDQMWLCEFEKLLADGFDETSITSTLAVLAVVRQNKPVSLAPIVAVYLVEYVALAQARKISYADN
jgi:hypothetical protein